jgi:hypothetical protein
MAARIGVLLVFLLLDHLQRFQAKASPALDAGWIPVRVKKTRQKIERPEHASTQAAVDDRHHT